MAKHKTSIFQLLFFAWAEGQGVIEFSNVDGKGPLANGEKFERQTDSHGPVHLQGNVRWGREGYICNWVLEGTAQACR
jgi:hypothetical protein